MGFIEFLSKICQKEETKEEVREVIRELTPKELEAKYYDMQVEKYLSHNTIKPIAEWHYKPIRPLYSYNEKNTVLVKFTDGTEQIIDIYTSVLMNKQKSEFEDEANNQNPEESGDEVPPSKVKQWLSENLDKILNGYLNAKDNGEFTYLFSLESQDVISTDDDFKELCELMNTQPFEIHQAANALLLQWG
ncbi:MAG: hypothetical protein E7272_07710 [Pseudobutyrivibrio ruminis]|uniref:Uncharacterized protein n=1 Tax=Pseudobutyrivibrio ruminis TaxID=46206 RepID=A0A927UCS7_9FIRM|nr:hypothetical protein [Pseudobutyrivibrio ruminis]